MGLKGALYRKFIRKRTEKTPRERKTPREKAEQLIEEHSISYRRHWFDIMMKDSVDEEDFEDVGKFYFVEQDFVEDSENKNKLEIVIIENGHPATYGDFNKDDIINALIKNKLDLKKTFNFLIKKAKKEGHEAMIEREIYKMKLADEKRKIRETAEKRLYGKIKTRRKILTEEETEIIFKKFGYKCAVCGATEGLHIHHMNENPKDNRIDNLSVLCSVCHKKIHMKVR